MTVIIVSCIAAWIIFSAILVTIICMNASLLSIGQEPFFDQAAYLRWLQKQEVKDD